LHDDVEAMITDADEYSTKYKLQVFVKNHCVTAKCRLYFPSRKLETNAPHRKK